MSKFFIVMPTINNHTEILEVDDYDKAIEHVRKHYLEYNRLPIVYHGNKLEFEPIDIVKSWKVKGWR